MNKSIKKEQILSMPYVDLMAFIKEVNRPPGGKNSIRVLVQNTFLTNKSQVLDVGCNTGYCSFEIFHLAKCRVIGADINEKMVMVAKKELKNNSASRRVKFMIGDAMNLPFENNRFDLVVSGGSTVFVENIPKAIKEYSRVLKPWGFIGDINFFYSSPPPKSLLNKLNKILGIKIEPWNKEYFLNLYKDAGLESYFTFEGKTYQPTIQEVKLYCKKMAKTNNLSKGAQDALVMRLTKIMSVFRENFKYLSYGVFILRKRVKEEQIALFGS